MKKKNVAGMFLLFSIAAVLLSCKKDNNIDISQLTGTWSVVNDDPDLAVDGAVEYTFNPDKTCSIYLYDALSGKDTILHRTYIISYDERLITLFNKQSIYTEQYHLLELTSREMRWENASPGDGNSDKKLEKVY